MVCMEVTRLLTEERERRGISENRLAAAAGLSQSLMTRFKKNLNNPNLDSLIRIAAALDVNIGKVLSQALRNIDKRAETAAGGSGRGDPRRAGERSVRGVSAGGRGTAARPLLLRHSPPWRRPFNAMVSLLMKNLRQNLFY